MTVLAHKLPTTAEVSDALSKTRARGLELVSDNLPRVADATDRAGRNVAQFLRSSAETISEKLREQQPSKASRVGAFLGSSWLLRSAGRLVARHPVALLVGGAVVAAAGVAAWRMSQPDTAAKSDATTDEDGAAEPTTTKTK